MRSPRPTIASLALPLVFPLAFAFTGCTANLDWREVRPEGAGILALFPCKPEVINRPATPAEPARMGLAQCKAAGLSFALSWAEVPAVAQVTPALRQMRQALAGKLEAKADVPQPLNVPGMTPNAEAQSQVLAGTQQARVAVFSRGRTVYQAVMLGAKRNEPAWESFAGSLKLVE